MRFLEAVANALTAAGYKLPAPRATEADRFGIALVEEGWPEDITEEGLTRASLRASGWPVGPELDMAVRIELDPVACQFMVSHHDLRYAVAHAMDIGFEAFRTGVEADAA